MRRLITKATEPKPAAEAKEDDVVRKVAEVVLRDWCDEQAVFRPPFARRLFSWPRLWCVAFKGKVNHKHLEGRQAVERNLLS